MDSLGRFDRRRFMKLAILTSATMAFHPELAFASNHDRHCANGGLPCDQCRFLDLRPTHRSRPETFNPWTDWRNSHGGSHYSGAPRGGHIVVHHHGACTQDQPASYKCTGAGYYYDFCIDRNGGFYSTGYWSSSTGGHAQAGCNCATIGIMMQGCYGGCGSCDLPSFNDQQLCALAYLSLHLGTPTTIDRYVPHRHCYYWNPCGGGSTWTQCAGDNLCSNSTTYHWNGTGTGQINRMLWMRSNLAAGCNCTGNIC